MEKLKCLTALFLAVMLTACAAPAAPPPETSAPPPPPAETSAPESQSPAPAIPAALPESIRVQQRGGSGEVYWDLLVTEPEDIQLVAGLLSTEELTPLEGWEERWPSGGSPIIMELNYSDSAVEACTYRKKVGDRATLRVGEIFYAYPEEKHDKLFEYLGSWEIAFMAS